MKSTIHINGMNAVHAVRAVETALTAVEGINRIDVRLGVAVVDHDGRASAAALRSAIEAAGLEVGEIVEETRRLL